MKEYDDRRMRIDDNIANSWYKKYTEEKYKEYRNNGLDIYHLTISWNYRREDVNSPDIMRRKFEKWWMSEFVPFIDKTRNPTKARISQRPECTAFVEIGEDSIWTEVKKLQDPKSKL